MRAYELYETNLVALGVYDPADDELRRREFGDTRKPKITLRDINRLKHIRNARKREKEKKLEFVPVMYSDAKFEQQASEQDLELERQKHELELAKLELERDQLELQNDIEKAEIDHEQRSNIRKKAQAVADKAIRKKSTE